MLPKEDINIKGFSHEEAKYVNVLDDSIINGWKIYIFFMLINL